MMFVENQSVPTLLPSFQPDRSDASRRRLSSGSGNTVRDSFGSQTASEL